MATTAATLEQELRLMIKTLTNLGYSEWTSISDDEVRKGNPRVYCSFLRFLFDRHPRVLHLLLSGINNTNGNATTSSKCSEGFGIYSPQYNNKPLQRSSINKYVATTLGFHAPSLSAGGGSNRHCGGVASENFSSSLNNNKNNNNGGGFIVEMDDSKFMQRLLQHVLPEHFAVTAPMTAHQFFRSTGGFVLQKAKLVRNVAALFTRREHQLEQQEQNRVDAVEHTKLLMERSRRHNTMKQCGVGEDLAYLEFEPRPLVDDSRNPSNIGGGMYSNLTSRQKVELAEKQRKAEISRRLDAIKDQEKKLNDIANRARRMIENNNNENDENNTRVSETGPLTLLASPERRGSSNYVVVNKQIEEMRRRDEEQLHEATRSKLLIDHARSGTNSGGRKNHRDQELVEERVMLVLSPSRRH